MVENGEKQTKHCFKQPSNKSLSHERAVRANERTDERVAQYCSLYFWLFSTIENLALRFFVVTALLFTFS